jgi:gluconokinase
MIILKPLPKVHYMNQCVTGIDIGTGSTKAVTIDTAGKVIASAQSYYGVNTPVEGYAEQDPMILWEAFVHCISEVAKQTGRLPMSVSISSAMHSLLVVDAGNNSITPLITWADTRSGQIAESLRQSPAGREIYTATGTPVHSMSPLCKIKWLQQHEPGIFSRAFKFISIKEFIWYRLFKDYQVDHSIASATGLFNTAGRCWHTASLEFCGIRPSQLSEPVATSFARNDVDATAASLFQIAGDTTFCIGASDGCLANIGSHAIEPGIAAVTIGTSGAVRIAGHNPLLNYEAMIFNYILDEGTIISGGPVNNGGNIVKWLFKAFLNNANPTEEDYRQLFASVEGIPAASQGLLFLPYVYGERSPVWDESASGVYLGIKEHHTRAHFLRAALEGICFGLQNILDILEAATVPIRQLNVSGGFVHSRLWMQLLCDVTNKNLLLTQSEDASAMGAALFFLKIKNLIPDYSIAAATSVTLTPSKANNALYEKYYSVYKGLYKQLSSSMHVLHDLNLPG